MNICTCYTPTIQRLQDGAMLHLGDAFDECLICRRNPNRTLKVTTKITFKVIVPLLLSFASMFWPLCAVAQLSGIQTIDSGYYHNCALHTTGGIKCWGYNAYGQLGDGTTVDSNVSVHVYGMSSGVKSISLGGWHTCALTTSGGVKCWGENWSGQLGDGTTTNRTTPVDVNGLSSGVQSVNVGDSHSCALTTSGGVKCWGWNSYGQLGDGTTSERLFPVDVKGLASGCLSITFGLHHTCALTTSRDVICWGMHGYGPLGVEVDRSIRVVMRGMATDTNAIPIESKR